MLCGTVQKTKGRSLCSSVSSPCLSESRRRCSQKAAATHVSRTPHVVNCRSSMEFSLSAPRYKSLGRSLPAGPSSNVGVGAFMGAAGAGTTSSFVAVASSAPPTGSFAAASASAESG